MEKIGPPLHIFFLLKDAIRLKKGVTLCFLKGGIRGDHVSLLTPAQINRLDKAQL